MSRPTQTPSILSALVISSLFFASNLEAEMCAIDAVPAATLLLPYFEVDLDNANGVNTLFSVHNATPEPSMAHITFWTNLSQPSLTFDLFLTGFDMQAVNLREIFDAGNLPITADEQSDPGDTISPHGTNPQWDGSFDAPPDCINFFPFYINPLIVGPIAERLINGHTGQPIPSLEGRCLGADLGDNVARGYITIDHSQRCSIDFPSFAGYFGGAEPVASDENRLWGDFIIQDPSRGTEARDTLVHIEADPEFDGTTTSSGYTFYGRYSGGADHREPLASQWGVRYLNGEEESTATHLLVWRDSTGAPDLFQDGLECGTGPDWFPLEETSVHCFDEEENEVEVCALEDEQCFPYETQKVKVGDGNLALPYLSGWCQLDLNVDDNFNGDIDFPGPGSPLAQSYVAAITETTGLFASATRATAFGSACNAPASFDPLFGDGFETGDTSSWGTTLP